MTEPNYKIEDALVSYDEFMVAYGESKGNKKDT